jgi:hypothetical protein
MICHPSPQAEDPLLALALAPEVTQGFSLGTPRPTTRRGFNPWGKPSLPPSQNPTPLDKHPLQTPPKSPQSPRHTPQTPIPSPNLTPLSNVLWTKKGGGGVSRLTAVFLLAACTLATQAQNKVQATKFGAKPDGTTLNTTAIQKAIDSTPEGSTLTFAPGTYLTGSLFLHSGITLEIPEGTTLIGSEHLVDYKQLPTRIAGIEMTWPSALLNVRDATNVTITGKGTIDGDGPIWWKSYWDLRKVDEPKGLRWASDYDAQRPRLTLIQNSSNVHLGGGITLKRSGFWTVQILYSHDVVVDGVTIRNNEGGKGPSTDGIDIDSSHDILVAHADIDVNDDALCLKSGRDSDGLRVNRPTYNVVLRDSIIRHGAAAVTIGSETSGGFRNIEAYNLTALAPVGSGVLIKSAHTRGGWADDIRFHDITLTGVAIPIHITMNWNPSYSYATIPAGVDRATMPSYYTTLTTVVPEAQGLPHFRNVHIWNIHATGARIAIQAAAYPNATLDTFRIDHVDIQAQTAGTIADARNWTLTDNHIQTADGSTLTFTNTPPKEPTAFGDR